jgi:hypothetical protein
MSCSAAQPPEVPAVPDLDFSVEAVEVERHAAAPQLTFKLRIEQAGGGITPIHAVALRCQLRIEPGRRAYDERQKAALLELFGPASQWGRSVRPMLWTHASATVPAFAGSTVADLPVPCTYDFNLAATKYFDALGDDGDIPLCLLFSGTVFYESATGGLLAAPISWNKEATHRLPARAWREMMDLYYPNVAFLQLDKDLFDRLRRFKIESGHATWEQAIEELLQPRSTGVPPATLRAEVPS